MKKKLVLLSCLFLFACSSKNKKENSSEVSTKNEMNIEPIIEDSSVVNKVGKKEVKKAVIVEAPISKKSDQNVTVTSPYDLLNTYIKNQDEESILKESSRLLMKNSSDIKALNSLAMVYYKKNQLGLAKNLLQRALKVNPSAPNYEIYSNLGIVSLAMDEKTDEKNDAIKYFKKALELNPMDSVSALNVGSQFVKNSDFEKAIQALEIPYKKGNKDYRVLNNYAVALVGVGKYDKASAIYNEALKENSQSKEVLFNYLILLVEHQKKYQEGQEIIQKLRFIGVPEESRAKFQEIELLARKEAK